MVLVQAISAAAAAAAAAAAPFQTDAQSLIPVRSSSSSSASASSTSSSTATCSSGYGGAQTWTKSEFWGKAGTSLQGGGKLVGEGTRRRNGGSMVCVKAEGFNFWTILGGRGLKGGEMAVNTDEGLKALFSEPEGSGKKKKKEEDSTEGRVEVSGIDGFEKGSDLVGGFPGGERGLVKFLHDYPPPPKKEEASKAERELDSLRRAIAGPETKAKTIVPPLLMPGMTVIVNDPRNTFHNYSGIVQRVTDGRAGVLFEGGNWDKLIAFKLTSLVRTTEGPPMTNPKSAILLQRQAPAPLP